MKSTKKPSYYVVFFSFVLFTFFLSSCDNGETIEKNLVQSVFFQYDFKNFAWGYTNYGWFIDNKGQIRGYEYPNQVKLVDSLGYISLDDLLHNYNQTDTLLGKIDMDDLNAKSKLIEGTLDGELSEKDWHGGDIGLHKIYCYFLDEQKGKYKVQVLSINGDFDQINTTNEAKDLIAFLSQFID